VTESAFQAARTIGFVVAVAIAVGLQRAFPFTGNRGSWRTNATLWVANAVALGVLCGGCACAVGAWADRRGIGVLNAAGAPTWVAIPAAIAALDFVAYAWHRANHQVPLLWRFHRVHHSDLAYTSSTALRFHPGEVLLALPLRLATILLLGAPVIGILAFELTFTLANLVEHGDIRLPRVVDRALAIVLVTPSLHRRHHWRGPAQHATNFGTITTVWDRVLGTYDAEGARTPVRTGVPDIDADLGPLAVLSLPFHRVR
jgi:sterol desaturase/sphingolipid hydroxylase (fatty acid hydroxylase superfamily)